MIHANTYQPGDRMRFLADRHDTTTGRVLIEAGRILTVVSTRIDPGDCRVIFTFAEMPGVDVKPFSHLVDKVPRP